MFSVKVDEDKAAPHTHRRSRSSHQQLSTSGCFSTLIHWNDRLLDIFAFTDHFKHNPRAVDHMTGFKAILNDWFKEA